MFMRTAQLMTETTTSEYERTRPDSDGLRPLSRPATEKKDAASITTMPCSSVNVYVTGEL